jgi:hypothetical protein
MQEGKHSPVSLPDEVVVVNVGLEAFGEAVRAQGAPAVDVEWRIPADGDAELVDALVRLYGRAAARVEAANREVLRRLKEGAPELVGVGSARDVVPGMEDRTILHPGPPLEWKDFCDPLRRSVRAAIAAEGWAPGGEAADRLVAHDEVVVLEAANHHSTVLPMATTIGPSAPVWIVECSREGGRGYSALNQGPGVMQWFGADERGAVDRLVWLRDVAAPVLGAALEASGPIDILSLASQAVLMGDDVHLRSQAATNLFIRDLLPALVELSDARAGEVARWLSGNHLFFLNLAMAAAKAITQAAGAIEGSSIVTSMARNGTTFGIELAGIPDRWFTAGAPPVESALFHAGFDADDAALDIGDSAVLELVGLGGAAAGASPAVATFLGGQMEAAAAATTAMARISAGRSDRFKVPYLGFRGSPLGIDVRKVVELGITPSINTGILHARSGQGQIGAGVARAPMECFRAALLALDEALG